MIVIVIVIDMPIRRVEILLAVPFTVRDRVHIPMVVALATST